jgi:hypothetical protein
LSENLNFVKTLKETKKSRATCFSKLISEIKMGKSTEWRKKGEPTRKSSCLQDAEYPWVWSQNMDCPEE